MFLFRKSLFGILSCSFAGLKGYQLGLKTSSIQDFSEKSRMELVLSPSWYPLSPAKEHERIPKSDFRDKNTPEMSYLARDVIPAQFLSPNSAYRKSYDVHTQKSVSFFYRFFLRFFLVPAPVTAEVTTCPDPLSCWYQPVQGPVSGTRL